MSRSVKLYRSHPKGLKVGNFGDELSLPLLERLFEVKPIPVPMQMAELLAAGSILDAYGRARLPRRILVQMLSRRDPLHVWGSGFMLEQSSSKWPRALEVHAVRGEMSAARISGFSGAIGDPGILVSRIVHKPTVPAASVCLVPHFVDEEHVNALELPPHWSIIHPDGDPLEVIAKIASAELIVSSSLHGLIVADSFGIPAVWASSMNSLYGNSHYKFFDHASARGTSFNSPKSYLELTQIPEQDLHSLATTPSRDMSQWQDELIASFPF